MNCWHCKNELILGGDYNIKAENKDYDRVTKLSCPKCYSQVDVYHPSVKLLKEYKESDKDKERVQKLSEDYIKERDAKKK